MKKILALVMAAVLLLTLATFVAAKNDYTYKAPYGTPELDGEIADVWANAMWTKVEDPHEGELRTDSRVRVKLLWDETHLYFLAEIYDTSRNYNCDNFEMYLDQNGDKTSSYGMDDTHTIFYVYSEKVKPEGWFYQPGAKVTLGEYDDNIYVLEGYLNWPNGSDSVWEGDEMGLEFMYNDATDYTNFLDALRWNCQTYPHGPGGTIPADAKPSHFASDWGTLILVAEDEGIWDGANMHTDATYPLEDEGEYIEDPTEAPTEAPTEDATDATEGGDTAPETFDFGVAAAIAAIVSLAGYVISKKR